MHACGGGEVFTHPKLVLREAKIYTLYKSWESKNMKKKWIKYRKDISKVIEVGSDLDMSSRIYDYINAGAIIINLLVSILYTFAEIRDRFGFGFVWIERATVIFFTIDYLLRILTAGELYNELTEAHAIKKYALSFTG